MTSQGMLINFSSGIPAEDNRITLVPSAYLLGYCGVRYEYIDKMKHVEVHQGTSEVINYELLLTAKKSLAMTFAYLNQQVSLTKN